MNFVINSPEFYYVTACCDQTVNRRLGYYTPLLAECFGGQELPHKPAVFEAFPRLVVKTREPVSDAKWCHVLLCDELVVLIRLPNLAHLRRFLNKLCTVCDFPFEVCTCGQRSTPPERRWTVNMVSDVSEMLYEEQFIQFLSRRRGRNLTVELEFDEQVETEDDVLDFENVFTERNRLSLDNVSHETLLHNTPTNWETLDGDNFRIQSGKKSYEIVLNEPEVYEPIVKLVEDATTVVFQLSRSRNIADISFAISAFVRSATGRSTGYLLKDLVTMAVRELKWYFNDEISIQGDEQKTKHWVDTLDEFYNNYGKMKDSLLAEKLKKVMNHLVAHIVYHRLGLNFDSKLFSQIEKEKIRPSLFECLTFADALASLLVFLLKQGRQAMLTGDITNMFISSTTTSEWMLKVKRLKMESEFLGNPKAVDLNIHKFLNEVRFTIEEGKTLVKFLRTETPEWRAITSLMMDVTAIQNRFLSITCAQSLRKQPLGVVLYGDPGIGKTSIENMISNFDCLRQNRPIGLDYKYQLPSDSEFLDNFKSYMHTVVIDDVAQHAPNKIQGVDPSLVLLLRIINNQPFCPPQAALEDKGKTPMMPDLVIITTNKFDMNLPIYYPASYAPMRRLKIHVTPKVKPEFRKAGGTDIDPEKAVSDDPYPNFWTFEVRVPRKKADTQQGEFVHIHTFAHTQDFLKWFGEQSDIHNRQQDDFLSMQTQQVGAKLCEDCKLPESMCECGIFGCGPKCTICGMLKAKCSCLVQASVSEVSMQLDTSKSRSDTEQVEFEQMKKEMLQMASDENIPFDDEKDDLEELLKQLLHVCADKLTDRQFFIRFRLFFRALPSTREAGTSTSDDESLFEEIFAPPVTTCEGLFELFNERKDDYIRPWRPKVHANKPVAYTLQLSFKFIKKFHKNEKYKQWLNAYAYGELPIVLSLGWTSQEIVDDYNNYNVYMDEKDDMEDMEVLAELLTTEVRDSLKMKGGFWDRILRWCIDLYFAFSYFRRSCRYFGKFAIVRRTFIRWFRPCLVRTENQKYLMRKVGQKLDSALGGDNPTVSLMLKATTAISTIAFGFYLVNTMKSDREKYVKPNNVWRPDENGVYRMVRDGKFTDEVMKVNNQPVKLEGMSPYNSEEVETPSDVRHKMIRKNMCALSLVNESVLDQDEVEQIRTELKDCLDDASEEMLRELTPQLLLSKPESGGFSEPQSVESVSGIVQALRDRGSIPERRPGDDKINPWNVPERHVTEADFSSKRTRGVDDFTRKFSSNVLIFHAYGREANGRIFRRAGRMFAVSESEFVTNNHTMPKDETLHLCVFYGGCDDKNVPHTMLEIQQLQITRVPLRDICVIKTRQLAHLFKDISANLVSKDFDGTYHGFYMIKQVDGSIRKLPVMGVVKTHVKVVKENFEMEAFCGTIPRDEQLTQEGDCGSPLILETPYGPALVGFHCVLNDVNRMVYASKFCREDLGVLAKPMKIQCTALGLKASDLYEAKTSYYDFHEGKVLMYHGELKGFRTRPKHHVFKTELHQQIIGRTVGGFVVEDKFGPPYMDSWRPQQVSLSEFIEPVKFMDEVLLNKCADVFFKHIMENLPEGEIDLMHPYSYEVAVNGMPGMAYVDSIKKSTSMGFPWKTTKRHYIEETLIPGYQDAVKFKDEIEDTIEEWIVRMENGERLHTIWSANLKDEPVKHKKYLIYKTRVFFSGSAPLLIIIRMYFMGFCRVVNRNNYLFFSAVGMNPHSLQWEELTKFLSKFGTKTCIAGDYAFFDKKMKMLIIRLAMKTIIRISEQSGKFSESDLNVMRVIMYELSNPSVDYFGMVVTLLGGEVSGHQLTTILNCVINLFYLMYCYGKVGYNVEEFFEKVVAILLGDDHVANVSPDRPKFSHTAIQEVMRSMGVDYTMADKESESVPYIDLSECTFLKRKFVYSEMLGVHVAPLDKESIFKMMTVQVASRTITKEEQLAQAIVSASMEAFFHGKEFFMSVEDMIGNLTVSEKLEEAQKRYPRPTWDQNVVRFWKTDVRSAAKEAGRSQKPPIQYIYCSGDEFVLQHSESVDTVSFLARAFPEIRVHGCVELDTLKDDTDRQDEPPDGPDNYRLTKETSESETQLNVPETQGSVDMVQEQTTFANESVPEKLIIDQEMNPNADSQLISTTLGRYLSRPTKILTYTWVENAPGGIQTTLSPWKLFFTHPYIANKLQSFGLIRCKLHVKLTVNASQFYYGSIGAFYQPKRPISYDTINWTKSTSGGQILISQRPHVWLNPQSVSTAEMELPFILPSNWLSTYNANSLDAMGVMDLVQFAALRSANGVTTTGVNIVIYAWATDVEITGPTYNAVLQSKKEYLPSGQISGPASTIANVASRLTDIPVIGPFAKATEMVSGTVGTLASYFGFTNVPNVRDVEPVKSVAFHTLASSQISEPINKLSLQPKQETTLFSKYEAQTEDPLHIAALVGRESFLCGSLWSTTDTENTVLFTSSVRPDLYSVISESKQAVIYDTPMSYVSRLFTYWTGDIIFRFKVIKTQYHRGRINITWDSQAVNAQYLPGYGHPSVMNIVFDLDETDEIEVRVPYMQAYPYLELAAFNGSTPDSKWSNGPSPTFNTTTGNGMIQARVINRLTAPEASSDVDVLVFVRGAENLSFAGPRDVSNYSSHFEVQSQKEYIFDGEPSNGDVDFSAEFFGEKIASLRELMHRQSLCLTLNPSLVASVASEAVVRVTLERTPPTPGYTPDGWYIFKSLVTPANTAKFMPSRMTPVTWMLPCFVGNKGSMNYSFNVRNQTSGVTDNSTRVEAIRADRSSTPGISYTTYDKDSSVSVHVHNANYRWNLPPTARGSALTSQTTQAGLSVNVPYYWPTRFQSNDLWQMYRSSPLVTSGVTLLASKPIGTYDAGMVIDVYSGSGPDFDLLFFTNVPTWYSYASGPTGA